MGGQSHDPGKTRAAGAWPGLTIRGFRPDIGDAAATYDVFFEAVHRGAASAYSAAERRAWAPTRLPPEDWQCRIEAQIARVAEADGRVLGFMVLGHDGHLDLAYVRPEAMGTGVADALYGELLAVARARAMHRLETQASRLARPFFARHGWRELNPVRVPRAGQVLVGYRMDLKLGT